MPTSTTILTELRRLAEPDDPTQRTSLELLRGLLSHCEEPWDRRRFAPGHVTASALVLHPREAAVLMVHHRRLGRWLLPGGHLEALDEGAGSAAAREALEETGVPVHRAGAPPLLRVDVHGIPPRRDEPFHLHHDLTFGFVAAASGLSPCSTEVVQAAWCSFAEAFERFPEAHLRPNRLESLRAGLQTT